DVDSDSLVTGLRYQQDGRARKHAGDYLGLIGGRIGASLLSAVGFGLVARFLGAEEYGQYALAVMISTAIATLAINWPNPGIIRYGRQEFNRSGHLGATFFSRILLFVGTLTLALGTIVFFHQAIDKYLGLPAGTGSLAIAALMIGFALYELTVSTLQAADRLRESALLQLFSKALFLAFFAGCFLDSNYTVKEVARKFEKEIY
ncbi:oligosaccharide flippase family protein, partial [Patescibacteria group bacterium]|nr:oligosaccharide flippase family protein [Patescibacteria group bacterium]